MTLKADGLGVVVEGDALVAMNAFDKRAKEPLGIWSFRSPVKVSQVPAQSGALFYEKDIITLVGNGQGCRHTGQSATDDECGALVLPTLFVIRLKVA